MIQRLIAARQTSGQTEANASGQGSVFSVSNLMMFARNCVTVIGVFALTTLAMMFSVRSWLISLKPCRRLPSRKWLKWTTHPHRQVWQC
jgi:hypothetical protein